jgi:hypothetical protein
MRVLYWPAWSGENCLEKAVGRKIAHRAARSTSLGIGLSLPTSNCQAPTPMTDFQIRFPQSVVFHRI